MIKALSYFFLLLTLGSLSCTDQGEDPQYIEIVSLQPSPHSRAINKAALVSMELNREVDLHQAEKITMRYVDDTAAVGNYPGWGLMPPLVKHLSSGPFIWKPGRTVEVIIPKTISDPEGHSMRSDIVFRFTIADDSLFQLASSIPTSGDTISLGSFQRWVGQLSFTDYLYLRDSVLTITPPARIYVGRVIATDGRSGPLSFAHFVIEGMVSNSRYEITVPREIRDHEGETLPQDYRIAFHTKP